MSGDANQLDACLRQFETIVSEVVDAVADRQTVDGHRRYQRGAFSGYRRFLELMDRVDASFGVPCVESTDQYCCHLAYNLYEIN